MDDNQGISLRLEIQAWLFEFGGFIGDKRQDSHIWLKCRHRGDRIRGQRTKLSTNEPFDEIQLRVFEAPGHVEALRDVCRISYSPASGHGLASCPNSVSGMVAFQADAYARLWRLLSEGRQLHYHIDITAVPCPPASEVARHWDVAAHKVLQIECFNMRAASVGFFD